MKCLAIPLTVLLLSFGTLPSPARVQIGGGAKVGGTAKVSVNVGGGETDFVTDSFTETSDTELSLHTGELGATWTEHPDVGYTAGTVEATLDHFIPTGTPTAYYASGVPPSADYCAEAEVFVASIIAINIAVAVRMDTTANSMYVFQLNNGTGWRTRKIVAGVQTTIGTEDTTTNLPGVGESRTMKLCMVGSTMTTYVNGSLLSGVGGTDTDITAAGRAGVRASGTASTSTGFHFSSFRAFTQ